MNRTIAGYVGAGVALVGVGAVLIAAPEPKVDPSYDFIPGNRRVTEEQIQRKLVSDGWTNVQIVQRGRYFMATASKDGRTDTFAVDLLTGRLKGWESDDDDWNC